MVLSFRNAPPVSRNKDPIRPSTFLARQKTYTKEMTPIRRAALDAGCVALDTDVLSAQKLDRLSFYAEIVRPQRIYASIFGCLCIGQTVHGTLSIARHGSLRRPFRDQDLAVVRALVPALSIADRLLLPVRAATSTSLAPSAHVPRLTERERGVVRYACRGLRDSEIALACGTSPNTVRNQLAAIFRKLEVTTRVELCRRALLEGLGDQ